MRRPWSVIHNRIGNIEHISRLRRNAAALCREGRLSDICITGHALINHNAVNVFVRVSIIGVAHISCHITVGQCNGILALYHNALAGILLSESRLTH